MRAARNLKIWYILINQREEGPYSLWDLKNDKRITPNTLVRKAGSKRFVPIGKVKELKDVFKDEVEEREEKQPQVWKREGETALMNPADPENPMTFLIFILLLLVVWIVYNILT